MARSEFLAKLKEALENDLNGRIVQENIEYYNSYIMDEVSKGKSEETVIAELGDPWIIARSIIEMAEGTERNGDGHSPYEEQRRPKSSGQTYEQNYKGQSNGPRVHMLGLDTWWKKLLLILGIAGVLLIVIAVIGGIVSLLMPVILPLVLVMFVIRLLGGRRS